MNASGILTTWPWAAFKVIALSLVPDPWLWRHGNSEVVNAFVFSTVNLYSLSFALQSFPPPISCFPFHPALASLEGLSCFFTLWQVSCVSTSILHACCFQHDLGSLSLLGMCSAAELKSPAVHCCSGLNWTLSPADITQAEEPIINHWQPDPFVYGIRKVQLCGRASSFSSCQTTSTSAQAVNPTQRLLLFQNQAIGCSAFKPPLSLPLPPVPCLLPDTAAVSAS